MLKKIKKFIVNRDEYYPNIQILAYHLFKAIKKILRKLRFIKPERLDRDMFDWPLYYLHYQGELKKTSKKYLRSLKADDYEFIDEKLVQKNLSIKPLHPCHQFLYETLLQQNPDSIFEMGCGAGDNMHNLKTLLPYARVCGVDLLGQQLKNLKKTYPHLANNVKQVDATVHFTKLPFSECDIAFTQAVIMHIHTDNLYLVALENLFKMAKKCIVMHEKAKNHPFKDAIQKLFNEGKIKWNNIFFYYQGNEKIKFSKLIICSSTPLDYPELTNYDILLKK